MFKFVSCFFVALKFLVFTAILCSLKCPTSARSSVVCSINTELFHRDCWSGQYWCTAGSARQYPTMERYKSYTSPEGATRIREMNTKKQNTVKRT